MYLKTDEFNTPDDIIITFDYFSSVYEKYDYFSVNFKQQTLSKVLSSSLHSCSIDLLEVFEALGSLSSNSSPGPDLIPNIFLSECKFVISTPLHYLFNLSLSLGFFPDKWKTSFIRPIPKSSSDLSNIENYRPISLLSLIPKIFESIVANKVLSVFNHVIIDDQHGFRRNKSTITNLLNFQNFVSDALSRGSNVDVIYTDFTKAFDKINHQILFTKLKQNGICGSFLSWVIFFIVDRQQIVSYKEHWSIPIHVTSGVLQGSHLAPILFLIFINDINFLNCTKLMFSDDMKIFRIVDNQNEADLLQLDLNTLYEWCSNNNFTLNTKKFQIMTFSRAQVISSFDYNLNGEPLLRTMEAIKDLGIYFDPKLKFDCHITDDSLALKSIYCSLVRSICEYGSII